MAFWSEAIPNLRRNSRWVLELNTTPGTGGTNFSTIKFALKKCDVPSFKVTNVQHSFANHKFNFPGRVEWNTINVTFASIPGATGTSNTLYNALLDGGYTTPDNIFPNKTEVKYNTLNKTNYSAKTGGSTGAKLYYLTDDGSVKNYWNIVNPFFTDIKFGSLDYGSDEIVDVQCVIRYDTATMETAS